jgi:hypothetical protein
MAPVYGATPGWANQFELSAQVPYRFLSFSKDTLIQFQSEAGAHLVDWGCSREDTPRSRQEKPTCPDGLSSLSGFGQAEEVRQGDDPVHGCENESS